MKYINIAGVTSPLLVLAALGTPITSHAEVLRADLDGFEEVPAVSTTGSGEFSAKIRPKGSEVEFELSYENLEGGVAQAHIHLGQRATNGGIVVFLCTNLGNSPVANTPPCPPSPATLTGTFDTSDVIDASGQGIGAGEFDKVVEAIRAGVTYVNVHSDLFPAGEIRGQIRGREGQILERLLDF